MSSSKAAPYFSTSVSCAATSINSPQDPQEAAHVLRLACGNGLRAEVWETFQTRFRIPRILEYYASTEGNFSLYNCEGEVGSPSAAYRLFLRSVTRWRSCVSMWSAASLCAMPPDCARLWASMKPAKRWA